jgi:hypothetical protein
MKALLVVMFFCFLRASAEGQIQWTDKNGLMHFDYAGSLNPPSGDIDLALPGTTTARIDRTHSALSLGDNDSSYRYSPSWRSEGADKSDDSLKADSKATWAVKISGNWRITFAFVRKNNAVVDYEDYH